MGVVFTMENWGRGWVGCKLSVPLVLDDPALS
jgi:hypothetical protein